MDSLKPPSPTNEQSPITSPEQPSSNPPKEVEAAKPKGKPGRKPKHFSLPAINPPPSPEQPSNNQLKPPWNNDHDPFTLDTWSYETPLEQPTGGTKLHERVITINGMPWQARSDCQYKFNYYKLVDRIEKSKSFTREQIKEKPFENELSIYHSLCRTDLWFFVYFVMKNPLANHPFIVEACKEIENDGEDALDVWARDHLKTTIISIARPIQKVLNDPERRIGIFSATRPLAVKIQSVIKALFESPFLIRSFPDILYTDPYKDAEKWSEAPEGGLIVKRKGFYKEPTISSWGLIEGMPTGYHLTDIVMDDIVTMDTLSPEITQKICDNFEMAMNLGSRDCQVNIVGTYYRHDDALVHITNLTDPATNQKMFPIRKKAATVDGTLLGKAVFLPEKTLAKKRAGKLIFFYCQQLLDPTPRGQERLNREHLKTVTRSQLPERLYKFMIIDGAGDEGKRADGRPPDKWAMGVIGVEPYRDELGLSNIYILDLVISQMDLIQAQESAVEMYCRNGRILKLGVEKVGLSSTEIHICSALRKRGRHVSLEHENLVILKPGGRSKAHRIESALSWPLKNGKVGILNTIPVAYSDTLKLEMEKFPRWHDDGLDILSYVYDMIKDFRFGDQVTEKKESAYDRAFRKAQEKGQKSGWIAV